MTRIYNFSYPEGLSDYKFTRLNGHAYTREVSGYHNLIRKGYPEPKYKDTVLAELYSPNVPPILWSTGSACWISVDFLVTSKFLAILQEAQITGFTTCPVEIVKVATKGKRKHKDKLSAGEPEDQINNRSNVIANVPLPELWGVKVTGTCEVAPIQMPPLDKDGRIRRYKFTEIAVSDLFHPMCDGKRYGGHRFCTERFKTLIEEKQIENTAFTPFDKWKKSIG
jgi:hypothetical protein